VKTKDIRWMKKMSSRTSTIEESRNRIESKKRRIEINSTWLTWYNQTFASIWSELVNVLRELILPSLS
jgi:hypothetical protein